MERTNHRRAFSLIELTVVVLIVGVLVGVAAPLALQSHGDASAAATVQHFRTIALACEMHRNDLGAWPDESVAGAMPAGMGSYLRPNLFAAACPAGGEYDWDKDIDGVAARLKVSSLSGSQAVWQAVDRELDDGDLTTGDLRMLAAAGGLGRRIVWVLED